MIENPPWADRILKTHWAQITAASPVPLLELGAYQGVARQDPMGLGIKGRSKVESDAMLGCGHYGCVLATADKGVVMKLTSDPTEAKFITEAMRLSLWPTGIVRYQQILPLEDTHKKRPVFVIWREAAREVGQAFSAALKRPRDDYQTRTIYEAERRLGQWLELGRIARVLVTNATDPAKTIAAAKAKRDWAWRTFDFEALEGSRLDERLVIPKYLRRWKGPDALALAIRGLGIVCEMGGSEPFMTEVFDALETYLNEDLLLADVHTGNLGIVDREDYTGGVKVITDPGHLVDLRAP